MQVVAAASIGTKGCMDSFSCKTANPKQNVPRTQHRRLLLVKSPLRRALCLFLVWIGLFSKRDNNNNRISNSNNKFYYSTMQRTALGLVSPTMAFSLSRTPRATMNRCSSRLLFRPTFGLYSSSTENGFFENDVHRLVQELSNEQQTKEQATTNSTANSSWNALKSDWLQHQEILSLVNNNIHKEKGASSSPVEARIIRNRTVHVKHDDQLKLDGSGISGNKARKMWILNEIPPQDFPDCLVSYGGPQSNSMLALAAICNYQSRQKQEQLANNDRTPTDNNNNTVGDSSMPVRFVYYTKKLPRFLRKQPNGNFFRALSLGMELVEVSPEEYSRMFEEQNPEGAPPQDLEAPCPRSLWVPQGGAFPPALPGAQRLAHEIIEYWSASSINRDKPLTVCVPGGTCTTAVLLHHQLQALSKDGSDDNNNDKSAPPMDIEVVVIPCVGDANYARRQMMSLSAQIGASPENIPTILQPQPEQVTKNNRYFSFGKPHRKILETFQELQDDCNLLVDLLYGAPSFAILWRHWGDNNEPSSLSPDLVFDPRQPLEGREIMYVHSGGLEGINSQLLRYKYNGLVEIKDVQLPGRQNRSRPTRRGNKKRQ